MMAALLGVIAGISVALVIWRTTSPPPDEGSRPGERDRSFAIDLPRDQGPFVEGRRVTLSAAAEQAGFHLYRPQDVLASDDSIRAIYLEDTGGPGPAGGQPHLAVDYESGILLMIEPAAGLPADRQSYLETLASEVGPPAAVQDVHGVPALLIPEAIHGQENPGSVMFVLNGVQVTIYGQYDSFTLDELTRVANSVA
jgi:hypothetical protein